MATSFRIISLLFLLFHDNCAGGDRGAVTNSCDGNPGADERCWKQAINRRPRPRPAHMVESAIHVGDGTYSVHVTVGDQPRELILDTGSGKTAFICQGCRSCGSGHLHPPFVPTTNTTIIQCDFLNAMQEQCSECVDGKCRYNQEYVQGDAWEAIKMADDIKLPGDGEALKSRIEFGCINKQSSLFVKQPTDGIIGLSRHPDSILSQFYANRAIDKRVFSHCLAIDGGFLTFGGVNTKVNLEDFMFTPLRIMNNQYWSVYLESIHIGNTEVGTYGSLLNPSKGCVLDSGTTYVYLPKAAKAPFTEAWRIELGSSTLVPVSGELFHLTEEEITKLPRVCFRFRHRVGLCMGPDAYMYHVGTHVYEGAIFFSDQAETTILGASAMRNHNILYDEENERIGIAPAICDGNTNSTKTSLVDVKTEQSYLESTDDKGATSNDSFVLVIVSMVIACVLGAIYICYKVRFQDADSSYEDEYVDDIEDEAQGGSPKSETNYQRMTALS